MSEPAQEFGVLYLSRDLARSRAALEVLGPFSTQTEAHVVAITRCAQQGGDYELMVRVAGGQPWRSGRGESPKDVVRRRRGREVEATPVRRTWTSSGRGVAWDWWRRRPDRPA